MDIIEDFSRLLSRHFSFEQRSMIEDALSLACQRLEGMTRWTGQPFVNHAVGVAAADGQAGLAQLRSAGSKVLVGGSQIDGHG